MALSTTTPQELTDTKPATSLRRQLASRANGSLSKGPKTAAGKAISSKNATRHGMLSNTIILNGESAERFADLLHALFAEHKPATESEATLVENMAVARWHQLRVWTVQKVAWDMAIAAQPRTAATLMPQLATAAFGEMVEKGRVLDTSQRYLASFDRQFTRALHNLHELQQRRPKDLPPLVYCIGGDGFTTFNSLPPEQPATEDTHHQAPPAMPDIAPPPEDIEDLQEIEEIEEIDPIDDTVAAITHTPETTCENRRHEPCPTNEHHLREHKTTLRRTES